MEAIQVCVLLSRLWFTQKIIKETLLFREVIITNKLTSNLLPKKPLFINRMIIITQKITYKIQIITMTFQLRTFQLKTSLKMITILMSDKIIKTLTILILINLRKITLNHTINQPPLTTTLLHSTVIPTNQLRPTYSLNRLWKMMEICLTLFLMRPMSKVEKLKSEDTNLVDIQMTTILLELLIDTRLSLSPIKLILRRLSFNPPLTNLTSIKVNQRLSELVTL